MSFDHRSVAIPVTDSTASATGSLLQGDLIAAPDSLALIIFAHGSGSSRHSPRNKAVADFLNQAGLSTLLIDLLTEEEERIDNQTRELRFDILLLAERLTKTVSWASEQDNLKQLSIGLFGASTGSASALICAAQTPELVGAVVSRGGRPDLAQSSLSRVRCPVLLLVGSLDVQVLELNQSAAAQMTCAKTLDVVSGASHLFEEPGTLEIVAQESSAWFLRHLQPSKNINESLNRRRQP